MATIHPTTAMSGALPEKAQQQLADLAIRRAFATGDAILRESATVPFLGIVEAGRVALRLHVPGRGAVTIVTLEPGELVGWSAIVAPYRATTDAVAVEPTRLVTYEAAELCRRLASDETLATAVLPPVVAALSDRLTTSWHQLLDLFGGPAAEPW